MLNNLRLVLILFCFSAFLTIAAAVDAKTDQDSTVDKILAKSLVVKVTVSQVDSLVKKQRKAVLLIYVEPQNIGRPNNSSNRQSHRFAELYKSISPRFPKLKF